MMKKAFKNPLAYSLSFGQDDATIHCYRQILMDSGYQPVFVHSVADMLMELKRQAGDLLLLDSDCIDEKSLKQVKALLGDPKVPILLLSDTMENGHIQTYLDCGIDDFIEKPVNPVLLEAKVKSLQRLWRLLTQQQENREQLKDYQRLMEQEQAVACNLFDNILHVNYLETPAVRSIVSAKSLFNGDIVLVGRTPDNRLHVLLGDFAGYGVSAYVAAAPTAEIFYGMTAKGFEITEIAEEINRKLYLLLPVDMFLAASLVGLHPDTRTIHVLNCNMPDQILVKRPANSVATFASNNLPLGIQGNIEFTLQTDEIGERDYFYLLSRSVSDSRNTAGEVFGIERIIECVCGYENTAFDGLLESLQNYSAVGREQLNLTFVELFCDVENIPWKFETAQDEFAGIEALSWKMMLEFDISTLRKLNPVPLMVDALMEIQGLHKYRQTIYLIVTELFANALDHGVLKLDSEIKQTSDGFMQYYQLKEERLQTVKHGYIRFSFNNQPTVSGGRLIIKVTDSGEGFSLHRVHEKLDANKGLSGRGIALLKTLCSDVYYQGKGNRVKVVFEWLIE